MLHSNFLALHFNQFLKILILKNTEYDIIRPVFTRIVPYGAKNEYRVFAY